MNCLVFLEMERSGDDVTLTGERLSLLRSRHRIEEKTEILAASIGGTRFRSRVVRVEVNKVHLVLLEELPKLSQFALHLVVGIARPPTVKKVLQLAASVGVERLSFVRTENSEKSYFMSSALNEAEIHDQVLLGLEQVGGGVPPLVKTYPLFRPFVEDVLGPCRHDELRCVGEVGVEGTFLECLKESTARTSTTLAIGGERGWSDFERESLRSAGFKSISLGDRMYRVEHAAALLLGQFISVGH